MKRLGLAHQPWRNSDLRCFWNRRFLFETTTCPGSRATAALTRLWLLSHSGSAPREFLAVGSFLKTPARLENDLTDHLPSIGDPRNARRAADLPELELAVGRLGELQNQESVIRDISADFWEREARRFAVSGHRDAALLAMIRALESDTPARRAALGGLLEPDYAQLMSSLRHPAGIRATAVNHTAGLVRTLNGENLLESWTLSDCSLSHPVSVTRGLQPRYDGRAHDLPPF